MTIIVFIVHQDDYSNLLISVILVRWSLPKESGTHLYAHKCEAGAYRGLPVSWEIIPAVGVSW